MTGPSPNANEANAIIWPEIWTAFASHRNNICRMLASLSPHPESRLCIWGSGRTTDLDLIELSRHYATIDLVDLHPNLTQQALDQRGFDSNHGVQAISSFDVTGLSSAWEKFQKNPSPDGITNLIAACRTSTLALGRYEVVASTCLLSQIMRHARECIESSGLTGATFQSTFPELIRALREQHLELLLEHTTAGGSSVLITDLTSSQALPEMLSDSSNLSHLIETKVVHGNHFDGLNPAIIAESLRLPRLARLIDQVQHSAPWIWDSIETQYLCLAFHMRRSNKTASDEGQR